MRALRFVAAGAVGGLVGAFVSLIWLVVYAIFGGIPAWAPLEQDAAHFFGQAVQAAGPAGRAYLGVGVHFLTGAFLGAVFGGLALLLRGQAPTRYSAWGFVYGAVLWLLARGSWLAPAPGRAAPWAMAVGLLLFGSFAGSYVGSTAGEAVREGRL